MNYQEAQEYILSFTDYEKLPGGYAAANFDLRRMEALLEALGHPELCLKAVHIAGTKGKGSTAAMLASALTASGYRTGLYTSPHLHTLRERLRIDGELISPQALTEATARVQPAVEEVRTHPLGPPSTFEVLTALAFLYFQEGGVDWAVLEVGLGGRLDATNVVIPRVSVLTSISYDHTEVLGDSLELIAGEKAGIIKPGVAAVSSPQHPEALRVLRQVCQERGCPLTVVGEEVKWQKLGWGLWGQALRVKGRRWSYPLLLPLLGEHQLENAATAFATLEWVAEAAPRLSPQRIAQGFASVSWPGRLQVLGTRPLMVADGAHNADSARRLREAVRGFPYERLILIMGASRDKDNAGIIRELAPLSPRVILTAAQHPRAAPAPLLAAEWAKYAVSPIVAPGVPQALLLARALAGEGDLVLITGSLFIVAEVLEAIGLGQRESF